jgi:hypothetical protein
MKWIDLQQQNKEKNLIGDLGSEGNGLLPAAPAGVVLGPLC